MFDFKNDGKKLMYLVTVSILVFLFFHNFTEPFRSHPNKIMENTVRILIFVPLLVFTWMKKDWARQVLGGLSAFLFLTGFIALFYFSKLYNGLGGLCYLIVQISLFSTFYHLLFSTVLKKFVKDQ
ncbi:MAG: hypothetical protein JXQ65_09420 [Candidatus Marinimicrobia bacterium]|nr:hypothetical protein [Candidatus Neomarinimicrobiota bacterium]